MAKFVTQQPKIIKRAPTGFTLIEMLIYMSLVAVATIIFTNFTIDIVRDASKTLASKEVDQSARVLMARLNQEIKTAKQITAVNPDQLTLIDMNGNSKVFSYDSSQASVFLATNGSSPVQISNNTVRVTKLIFSQKSPQVVSIDLTVDQKNPQATKSQTSHLELSAVIIPRLQLY